MWSNLVRDAATIKGVKQEDLSLADALKIWLTSLPQKTFDQVLEILTGSGASDDGLTDEEWVREGDRETAIERMNRNRQ